MQAHRRSLADLVKRWKKCAFVRRRYRNFRTLTSPQPAQFSSLAVDGSGELVSAAAQDSFDIFLWSMQTGRLLEVLGSVPAVSILQQKQPVQTVTKTVME